MNRILLLLAGSCYIIPGLLAQEADAQDTVSLMPGYADQVWYSMEEGEVGRTALDSWDLAFSITGFHASIYANNAKGIEVYVYPNGDTASWSSLDTAGMDNWTPYYNDPTSWTKGAFSAGIDTSDQVDLGWGTYNFITHHVVGDSLFVLQFLDGSIQKLWIERLASGTYTFRHSDLEGTNDMTHSIAKSDYEGKNFGYYNLTTHTALDPEPNHSTWDLLFTRYIDYVPAPYGVSGVLLNGDVEAVKVYPVDDPDTYDDYLSHEFSAEINTIGYDWKNFSSVSGWSLQDSLVYFVKSADEDIFKIVWTEFGGSGTGEFMFNKTKLLSSSLENSLAGSFFNLFPNPLQGNTVNFVLDLASPQGIGTASIVDLQGRTSFTQDINLPGGLTQYRLDIPALSPGIYFFHVQVDGGRITEKLVVR